MIEGCFLMGKCRGSRFWGWGCSLASEFAEVDHRSIGDIVLYDVSRSDAGERLLSWLWPNRLGGCFESHLNAAVFAPRYLGYLQPLPREELLGKEPREELLGKETA